MSLAKQGDTVRVHYIGRFQDGNVFDSSHDRDPLELTLGAGQVISGVERAIVGMLPGQTKSVQVPAAEAFGQRQDEKVLRCERSEFPANVDPHVGQQMKLQTRDGHAVSAVVTSVSESTVTVDTNHPLAGRELRFDLELIEIV